MPSSISRKYNLDTSSDGLKPSNTGNDDKELRCFCIFMKIELSLAIINIYRYPQQLSDFQISLPYKLNNRLIKSLHGKQSISKQVKKVQAAFLFYTKRSCSYAWFKGY